MSTVITEVSNNVDKISNELSSFLTESKDQLIISNQLDIEIDEVKNENTTQPLSLKCFRSRVQTYSPGLWSLRHLSPLTCARYGWVLSEKEVLQCVTCRAIVCTALPSSKDTLAYDKFLKMLGDKLIEGHVDGCGWQHNSSPTYFCHPPNINSKDHLRNFSNHARSFASQQDKLPYLDYEKICKEWDVKKEDLKSVFGSTSDLSEEEITAALLSLSGWTCSKESYLHCNICQRSIGLWSYTSRQLYKDETEKQLQLIQKEKETINAHSNEATSMDCESSTDNVDKDKQEDSGIANSNSEDNSNDNINTEGEVDSSPKSPESEEDNNPENSQETDVTSESNPDTSEKYVDKTDENADQSEKNEESNQPDKEESSSKEVELEETELLSDPPTGEVSRKRRTSCEDSTEIDREHPTKKLCKDNGSNEVQDLEEFNTEVHTKVLKELEKMGKRLLNPVIEHRHWCGWIVERDLSSDLNDLYYDDLRGFKVFINQIKTYLNPNTSEMVNSLKCQNNVDGLRAVRNLLDQWIGTEEEENDSD